MLIRPAGPEDRRAIWSVIAPVIRAGETCPLARNLTEAEALGYGLCSDKETFVAEDGGAILGTYDMRPNQAGGGSHVCNCGCMTGTAAIVRVGPVNPILAISGPYWRRVRHRPPPSGRPLQRLHQGPARGRG